MPEDSTTDDVQAHTLKSGRGPAQPAETEAHGLSARGRDDEDPPAKGKREDSRDDGPDVEGHGFSSGR